MATAQGGVIAHWQLKAIGLADRAIARRLETGRLHVMHRGVYALGHRVVSQRGRWIAAVLACGDGAALNQRSAGARRDLGVIERGGIDVLVPDRSDRAHPGIRLHRPRSLAAQDIEQVDGIPCTSLARTLVDLAGVVRRRELERAIEAAAHQRVLDMTAIADVLDRVARPRGVRTLRALLAQHVRGTTVTRSEHEERFLALARRHDLPPFLMNQRVALGDGRVYDVDVLFPSARVAVELDTFQTHGTPAAFRRDRRRDAELSALGYHPMRFTWDDVTRDGARTVALIAAVLRRR